MARGMQIVAHADVDESDGGVYVDLVCEWVGHGEKRGLHAWRNGKPGLFDPGARTFYEGRHKSRRDAQQRFLDRLLVELYTAAAVQRCDAAEYLFYATQIFYSPVAEAHERGLGDFLAALASLVEELFPPLPPDENQRPQRRPHVRNLCVRFTAARVVADAGKRCMAKKTAPIAKRAAVAART